MALPKNVQRQLAEAEALQQGLQEQAANAPQNVVLDVSALAAAAPAPAPAPAAPSIPAPAPTPAPASAEDWQQRFKTLQGMYNADAAKFATQLKVYQAQLSTMGEQIQALTEAAKAKPAEPAKVDPRDASQFGEDLVEMVNRYATRAFEQMRAEFGQYAQSLDGRVKELEARVTGVSGQTAETLKQIFYADLTKSVPEWRQINQMPQWLEWLGEEDELYGMTRQDALDDAHGKLDAKRVTAIFNRFKTDVLVRQPNLETQMAPPSGASASPAPAQATAPQMISAQVINQLYLDFAKGKYKGREDEFARLEAEINMAIAQGRVV